MQINLIKVGCFYESSEPGAHLGWFPAALTTMLAAVKCSTSCSHSRLRVSRRSSLFCAQLPRRIVGSVVSPHCDIYKTYHRNKRGFSKTNSDISRSSYSSFSRLVGWLQLPTEINFLHGWDVLCFRSTRFSINGWLTATSYRCNTSKK